MDKLWPVKYWYKIIQIIAKAAFFSLFIAIPRFSLDPTRWCIPDTIDLCWNCRKLAEEARYHSNLLKHRNTEFELSGILPVVVRVFELFLVLTPPSGSTGPIYLLSSAYCVLSVVLITQRSWVQSPYWQLSRPAQSHDK